MGSLSLSSLFLISILRIPGFIPCCCTKKGAKEAGGKDRETKGPLARVPEATKKNVNTHTFRAARYVLPSLLRVFDLTAVKIQGGWPPACGPSLSKNWGVLQSLVKTFTILPGELSSESTLRRPWSGSEDRPRSDPLVSWTMSEWSSGSPGASGRVSDRSWLRGLSNRNASAAAPSSQEPRVPQSESSHLPRPIPVLPLPASA